MNKFIVIFYSLLILLQSFNINIEDISKFSTLLEHANYHQEIYGDSFIEFLSEHYGEQMTSHKDKHKEHKDLPFKDNYHIFTQINTAFTLSQNSAYSFLCQSFEEAPLNFFYKDPISFFKKPTVFQPPRLA